MKHLSRRASYELLKLGTAQRKKGVVRRKRYPKKPPRNAAERPAKREIAASLGKQASRPNRVKKTESAARKLGI